jgi:hypothetical protein
MKAALLSELLMIGNELGTPQEESAEPITLLAQLLDLQVVLLDLDCHLRDLLEHRTERLCQSRRHNRKAALSEAPCSRGWRTIAAGLCQATNVFTAAVRSRTRSPRHGSG